MSDVSTQKIDAAGMPMAGVMIQGQLGPNIVGSGSMVFQGPGTLLFYFEPQTPGQSSVLYANNGGKPSTALPPYIWTPVPEVNNLNLDYSVSSGSDLKLAWAS